MIKMAMTRGFVVIVTIVTFFVGVSRGSFVSVVKDGKSGSLHFADTKENAVAWSSFESTINKTGWSYLEVYTNGSHDDILQAYAAGLAEGHITHDLFEMSLYNQEGSFCEEASTFCTNLKTFLEVNMKWMDDQIDTNAGHDPYWHHISLMLAQINGLHDGYNGKPGTPSAKITDPMQTMFLLQISGDMEDLSEALKAADDLSERPLGSGHCSALIKLLPGFKELYVSQDTWSTFSSMLRILKKYDFQFHQTADSNSAIMPGQVMTFSSYPGVLASGDDLYLISSGLATLETTIGNSNAGLWQYVTPTNSVLETFRSMAANRLTTSGDAWVKMFAQYNSGTYNNEWMVVDYKMFKPGTKPTQGLLYVLEQIPKYVVHKDLTSVLVDQMYWPSYNSPYFPDIYNMSGVGELAKKYGDWFTYDHTPRANIFRRDHVKVKDMDSMIKLMRYNDFTHDPLSRCNCTPPYSAENGISARSDLNPANGTYPFSALGHRSHGGTDMKVTSASMFEKLQFISQAGPTFDQVPPFKWSTSGFTDRHRGHPDEFTFKPIQHKWGARSD